MNLWDLICAIFRVGVMMYLMMLLVMGMVFVVGAIFRGAFWLIDCWKDRG